MLKLLDSNKFLVEGIKFASSELANRIKEDIFNPISSKKSRHQHERLMSFILRAVYRTTPFATFAYTSSIASINDINSINKPGISDAANAKTSVDMRFIQHALLEAIDGSDFVRSLTLRVNPFLFVSQGDFVFTNSLQSGRAVLLRRPITNSISKLLALFKNPRAVEDVLEQAMNDHEDLLKQIKEGLKNGLLVNSCQSSSEDLCSKLRDVKKNFTFHRYKDVASSMPATLSTHLYKNSEEALKQWCKRTVGLSWVEAENSILRAYFDRVFPGHTSVAFLDFFRSYVNNPPIKEKSNILENIFLQRQRLLHVIERVCVERGGYLRDKDIDFLNFNEESVYPQSIAVQVFPTAENKWVLPYGAYQYGFGRGCSRFLDLHPKLLEELRVRYRNINNVIMAELRSPEFFSGNIYPPIFDHSICLPDQFIANQEGAIPIFWRDLRVTKIGANTLRLTNSMGQIVLPVDLGFLDFKQRHPLYRLLNCFGPFERFALQLPWGDPNALKIESRPRVTFEEALVVSRKTWRIPINALEFSKDNEKDCDFAQRLLDWAERNTMPFEGFFRLLDPSHVSFVRPVEKKNILSSSILYRQAKPQYYNFTNPLIIKRWRILMSALQKEKKNCLTGNSRIIALYIFF